MLHHSDLRRGHRRRSLAALAALTLGGAALPAGLAPRPAEASPQAAPAAYAPNCVNVVLRDAFWGQFRHAIERGGNAAGVPGALARAGFAVSGAPSAGAVISWPAGAYGASGAGHVGIVAAVHENGVVLVRHENWPYGAGEHLQAFAVRPGFQFVHRSDAAGDAVPAANASNAAEAGAPGVPSTETTPGQRTHTIQLGDTLYAISRAHGTTVDALVAANELGTPAAILQVGRKLTIP